MPEQDTLGVRPGQTRDYLLRVPILAYQLPQR